MANKPLKTIQFPNLPDTYTVPQVDSTLSVTGGAADAKATGDTLAEKADKDGVIATAEGLIGGAYTIEKEPYHFRKTAVDLAGRLAETIVGGSLGWNQLANVTAHTDSRNGITYEYRNDGTVLVNGTATADSYSNIGTAVQIQGHKILMVGCPSGGSASTYYLRDGYNSYEFDVGNGRIVEARANTLPQINVKNGVTVSNLVFKPQFIDLTTLFGSTIADYIYSLEQSSAGAGVDWVRQYIDLDTYHEYCEPTLKSVEGLVSHDVVGFNQWDEEWELGSLDDATGQKISYSTTIRSKNYVPVLPDTSYYIYVGTNSAIRMFFYDADKDFISFVATGNVLFTTPSNAHYIMFRTYQAYGTIYNHDICINLSDPSRNGTYEPYEKHSYPLDSSVTLQGIPKLDSNNKLCFDGDIYPPSGEVTRRYGERAYQSGDESLADAITDGTTTVYKLTTTTTETAQPYQSPQLVGSTEEYVTTGVVPVGHESRYYEDITGKVNNLPSDFSTLIAPVEKSFTATRNYAVGSFVIVNNQLYKVTSAISSGGTITPNSNVTATTIMAEILALA